MKRLGKRFFRAIGQPVPTPKEPRAKPVKAPDESTFVSRSELKRLRDHFDTELRKLKAQLEEFRTKYDQLKKP